MTEDHQVLHGLRQTLEDAENAGDAETIAAAMAQDVVVMVPTFEVKEGREACTGFIRDVLHGLHAKYERKVAYVSAEISVFGTVAIDRGTFSFTTSPRSGGPAERATGKYLWLYSRGEAGSWQLARVIASLDEHEDEHAEEENVTPNPSEQKTRSAGAGIAIGLAIGVAIGAATGNMGMWIAIGIAIGLALGASRGARS
jgi:ketosteroid isomerase-like protein